MKTLAIASAGLALASGFAAVPQSAEAQVQLRGAPRGSFADSCSGAYVNQGRLYADCRDMRGRIRETSIQLNRCSDSDIANENGRLVCHGHRGDYEDNGGGWNDRPNRPERPDRPGRPGWDGPNWGGQGGTITVYRDANYQGRSLTLRGEVPNLRASGLNDAISSLRVRGGEWEVCTDANFQGRCEVVSGDIRDLSRWRMNDQISSLRFIGPRRAY